MQCISGSNTQKTEATTATTEDKKNVKENKFKWSDDVVAVAAAAAETIVGSGVQTQQVDNKFIYCQPNIIVNLNKKAFSI